MGVSCCVAMGPDRDLIHPDAAIRESGMAYVRGAIEAGGVMPLPPYIKRQAGAAGVGAVLPAGSGALATRSTYSPRTGANTP